MSNAATKMILGHNESTGGRLVTADGRTLALRGATLRADARGGVARVVLEQRFDNAYQRAAGGHVPHAAAGRRRGVGLRVHHR